MLRAVRFSTAKPSLLRRTNARMSVSGWGNRGSSIRPCARRPERSNSSGRLCRRVIADAETHFCLAPQAAQDRQVSCQGTGQRTAQLRRDLHGLDRAADAQLRPVRIDFPFEYQLPEVVAAERSLQLAALLAGLRLTEDGQRRKRQVDFTQRERARRDLRRIENLDRSVLDRDFRRPDTELRKRQKPRTAPSAIAAAGHPQGRATHRDPRYLQIPAEQLLHARLAAQQALIVAEQFGPRPFRCGIHDRQPSDQDSFPLDQHGGAYFDLKVRVVLGNERFHPTANLFVHPVIKIGDRQRGPDHACDQTPLEPEPTEVDQAMSDSPQPSVAWHMAMSE